MGLDDRLRRLEARLGVGDFAPKTCPQCGRAGGVVGVIETHFGDGRGLVNEIRGRRPKIHGAYETTVCETKSLHCILGRTAI